MNILITTHHFAAKITTFSHKLTLFTTDKKILPHFLIFCNPFSYPKIMQNPTKKGLAALREASFAQDIVVAVKSIHHIYSLYNY